MSIRHLFLSLCLMGAAMAEPIGDQTPLSAIKGSILVPKGWFLKESTEDGVTVYQITREKVESEHDPFTAGLIFSVTTKVPERTEMKPGAYAEELFSAGEDGAQPEKHLDPPWETLKNSYRLEGESGDVQIVTWAKANDDSGTLYFITWQSPVAEEEKLGPVRESILSSLKLDSSY